MLAKTVILLLCACLVYSRATDLKLEKRQAIQNTATETKDSYENSIEEIEQAVHENKFNNEVTDDDKETSNDNDDYNMKEDVEVENIQNEDKFDDDDFPSTNDNKQDKEMSTEDNTNEDTDEKVEDMNDAVDEMDADSENDNEFQSQEQEDFNDDETFNDKDEQQEKDGENDDSITDDNDKETEIEEEHDTTEVEEKEYPAEGEDKKEGNEMEEIEVPAQEDQVKESEIPLQDQHVDSAILKCNYTIKNMTIRQPVMMNTSCMIVRTPVLRRYRKRYSVPSYKCRNVPLKVYYTKRLCGMVHSIKYCNMTLAFKIVNKRVCSLRYFRRSVVLKRIVYRYRIVKKPRFVYVTKVFKVKTFKCY